MRISVSMVTILLALGVFSAGPLVKFSPLTATAAYADDDSGSSDNSGSSEHGGTGSSTSGHEVNDKNDNSGVSGHDDTSDDNNDDMDDDSKASSTTSTPTPAKMASSGCANLACLFTKKK